jgi:hypothetical protein
MQKVTVKKKLDREEQAHQARLVDSGATKKLGYKKAPAKKATPKKKSK